MKKTDPIQQIEPVRDGNAAHGDVLISLSEYGDQRKPGVILIHGVGHRSDDRLPAISTLANSFRVISINPRRLNRRRNALAA